MTIQVFACILSLKDVSSGQRIRYLEDLIFIPKPPFIGPFIYLNFSQWQFY